MARHQRVTASCAFTSVLPSPPTDKGSWEDIQPRSLGSYPCRGLHVIGRYLPNVSRSKCPTSY
jgi:hypothetical protein